MKATITRKHKITKTVATSKKNRYKTLNSTRSTDRTRNDQCAADLKNSTVCYSTDTTSLIDQWCHLVLLYNKQVTTTFESFSSVPSIKTERLNVFY